MVSKIIELERARQELLLKEYNTEFPDDIDINLAVQHELILINLKEYIEHQLMMWEVLPRECNLEKSLIDSFKEDIEELKEMIKRYGK